MKKNILLTGAVLSVAAAAAIFGLMDRSQAASLSDYSPGSNIVASSTSKIAKALKQKQKTQLTAAQIEVRRVAMQKNKAAIDAAIKASDYTAWVTAMGPNNPWASKITKDNFPKFVQAYNLRQQADQIMTDLGIQGGMGEGPGFGFGMMGNGQGMGHGTGNGRGLHLGQKPNTTATSTNTNN